MYHGELAMERPRERAFAVGRPDKACKVRRRAPKIVASIIFFTRVDTYRYDPSSPKQQASYRRRHGQPDRYGGVEPLLPRHHPPHRVDAFRPAVSAISATVIYLPRDRNLILVLSNRTSNHVLCTPLYPAHSPPFRGGVDLDRIVH
jgi:hypothetical protein